MSLLSQAAVVRGDSNYTETVPRSLVHKRSLENVLVTDINAVAHDRFICGGRIPTEHGFFNDTGRTPVKDILFYTELGRQASLAISHAFLDVSTDDVFIFEGSEATVADPAWRSASPPAADSIVIDIAIQNVTRRRNNAVSRVVAEHRMVIGGELVFHGTGAWAIQPAALFQRLRRMSNPRTSPPQATAPRPVSGGNVVITPPARVGDTASFVASLIIDQTHPYFFDHPCDHVPGMLLLEGCAQLAVAAFAETYSAPRAVSAIRAYDVNFAQFVESGVPTTLTAQVNVDQSVDITISQQDIVSGTTRMSVASPV